MKCLRKSGAKEVRNKENWQDDKIFVCLFVWCLERVEGREGWEERNFHVREIHQWVASHMHPDLGTGD